MKKFLPILCCLIPILGFTVFFFLYVVNIPWFDDFEALSGFFLEFIKAPTWSEKWYWLFLPNNEHRMVTGKLITLGVYYLTGFLDYRWIQGIADASVIGIWVLLLLAFRRLKLSYWYFLPVSLVLFQPQYYLLSFWAITGLQHQPLLFLVCLTMYVLALRTTGSFFIAFVLALVTTFTMSNGMFIWAAGLGLLLIRKRFRELFVWITGMAAGIAGYFYHFPTLANESSFSKFLKMPHLSVSGFFTFTGGAFDFFPQMSEPWRFVLPTLVGLLLMILLVRWFIQLFWPIIRSYFRTASPVSSSHTFVPDFILGVLLFLLANASVIAILRPHFGYYVMLISNYRLYAILFLCLTYLAWLSSPAFSSKSVRWVLPASGLFLLLSYLSYAPLVVERRKLLLTNAFNQYHSNVGLAATRGTILEPYIVWAYKEPIQMGVFTPPVHFFDSDLKSPIQPQSIAVQVQQDTARITLLQQDLTVPQKRNSMILLHLTSTQHTDQYLIPFQALPNPGRNPFVKGKGGTASFSARLLLPGEYTMEIIEKDGSSAKRYHVLNKLSI